MQTKAKSSLTSKQELFAQSVASGMSQADAYRNVYSCKSASNKSIWERASRLMKFGSKVSARVEHLKAELAKKNLWTREMSIKGLVEAYKISKDDRTPASMVSAIKEINAMHGFNKPDQEDSDNTKKTIEIVMIKGKRDAS